MALLIAARAGAIVACALVPALLAVSGCAGTGRTSPAPLTYRDARFAATHNSYSGNIDGARGSLPEQLDAGVRGLELDVHTAPGGAFLVGHDEPGDEVATGNGNPEGLQLDDWVATIAGWSRSHTSHAPITLYLDLKWETGDSRDDDLSGIDSILDDALGDRLLRAADTGESFPPLADLRGRVIVVLTGQVDHRLRYTRDRQGRIAFVEFQRGDPPELGRAGVRFFAADARDEYDRGWALDRMADGGLVRLWRFDPERHATRPPVHFPATDHPYHEPYDRYRARVGAVAWVRGAAAARPR